MIVSALALLMLTKVGDLHVEDRCRFDQARVVRGTRPSNPRDRDNYEWHDEREFEGVWANEFEGSSFYEGVETAELVDLEDRQLWLSIDSQTTLPPDFRPQNGQMYRITMRACSASKRLRSRGRGRGYGHFGLWQGMVVANEIVAWEHIGPIQR